MADTNEGFQRKYFLLNNDRQQECVLVCEQEKQKAGPGDPWHRNHEEQNEKRKLRRRTKLEHGLHGPWCSEGNRLQR